MSPPKKLAPLALLLLSCSGAGAPEEESLAVALSRAAERDLPWEVSTPDGESVLPNVFYAEASENEQVASTKIEGRHLIDRLVYPTLGNPNLFVRSEPKDAFMMVLRVEPELLSHLAPREVSVGAGRLRVLELSETDRDRLAFYAIDRAARPIATEEREAVWPQRGVHALRPSSILVQPVEGDMPAAFRSRITLRVVFDDAAMQAVPAGLYDVRMEVVRRGAVASAPDGQPAREFQYNALRVFDQPAGSIVNVTDTQVSVGSHMEGATLTKLHELVVGLTTSADPRVRDAAFITFNGDLHNGGSPEVVKPLTVARTYQEEATAIVRALRELPLPIFLTMGNHDGYASVGHAPAVFDNLVADGLDASIADAAREVARGGDWPGYSWEAHRAFLDATSSTLGGRHVDVLSGAFARRVASTFAAAWLPIDRARRNVVLYDGVHQWQRTYGPTHTSWRYGRSRFVNLNSYELRQHRRTGWGMYTVNYGGAVSPVQLDWATRQIERAEREGDDVVLVAHHDPRGGHEGKDYPFYFEQVDFAGMDQSLWSFVTAEITKEAVCRYMPKWAKDEVHEARCLHDGLQEWMRPDPEFDCRDEDRLAGDPDGRCDVARFVGGARRPWYSGFALLDLIHRSPRVRTMLLGHTHANSLEVAQSGDALVPTEVAIDPATAAKYEVANPMRARGDEKRKDEQASVERQRKGIVDLEAAGFGFEHRALEGERRELVILRTSCNADLSSQTRGEDAAIGFVTLGLSRRADYDAAQINDVTFFLNRRGGFDEVRRVPIARDRRVGSAATDPGNPLRALFVTN